MKKFLLFLIVPLISFLAFNVSIKNVLADEIIASQTSYNGADGTTGTYYQTFTDNTFSQYQITKIEQMFRASYAGTFDYYLTITDGCNGNILATSDTVSITGTLNTYFWITFTFDDPAILNANTEYRYNIIGNTSTGKRPARQYGNYYTNGIKGYEHATTHACYTFNHDLTFKIWADEYISQLQEESMSEDLLDYMKNNNFPIILITAVSAILSLWTISL